MGSRLCVIAVLAALGVAGCGEDEPDGPEAQGSVASEPTDPVEPPVDRATPQEAEDVVRRFYDLIDRYEYRTAWTLMPPTIKAEAGSFDRWRKGYRWNIRTDLRSVGALDTQGRQIGVTVELDAVDLDACNGKRVKQSFAGTWTLVARGGMWDPVDLAIDKVAGGTPRLTVSECPVPDIRAGGGGGGGYGGGGGAGPPYDRPPGDAYDRPYPDLDCEDVSGPIYVGPSDPHGFDADGDGIGCE